MLFLQHQAFSIKMSMMLLVLILLGSYVCLSESQPPNPKIPIRTAPIVLNSTTSSENSCSSQSTIDILDDEWRETREFINYRLRPCQCGGPGWTRVLHINMSDPGNSCPSNLALHANQVRGCGRKSAMSRTCDSILIPVNMKYSLICGRSYAYQKGESYAFFNKYFWSRQTITIEDAYVSGLSLTHGAVGERKHVWTFAGAWAKGSGQTYPETSCPCINSTHVWPYQVPSYVGDSYFCDTGANTFNRNDDYNKLFMDDLLWDGEGCSGSNTCCSYNSPPWFCKNLKYHTSDNLELRLCTYWNGCCEDKLISLVEIYVK